MPSDFGQAHLFDLASKKFREIDSQTVLDLYDVIRREQLGPQNAASDTSSVFKQGGTAKPSADEEQTPMRKQPTLKSAIDKRDSDIVSQMRK